MYLVTAEQMRALDAAAVSLGIPAIVLMENAAEGLCAEIEKQCPRTVLIFTGKGQNAGDGFAAARLLYNRGIDVSLIMCAPAVELTGDALTNYDITQKMNIPTYSYAPDRAYAADVIVDCILGIGLRGSVEGLYAGAIESINASEAYVISADIPSGISADTGEVCAAAVRADKTVTFGYMKLGLFSPLSIDCTGEVILRGISIPRNLPALSQINTFHLSMRDITLPNTSRAENKSAGGRVLIAGGSAGMAGAVALAADAAQKMGAGLVTCAVPGEILTPMMSLLRAAMCTPLDKVDFSLYDSVLIGNGMGTDSDEYLRRALTECKKTLVIDADGINMLSKNTQLLKNRDCEIILTPHPLEFSRLTGVTVSEIVKNRLTLSRAFAREFGVYLVLKGACTVVAAPDGRAYINTTGNQGMAKGGSGDVLAGMTAGIAPRMGSSLKSALACVCLHGRAGDLAAASMGTLSVSATDIIENIPAALMQL